MVVLFLCLPPSGGAEPKNNSRSDIEPAVPFLYPQLDYNVSLTQIAEFCKCFLKLIFIIFQENDFICPNLFIPTFFLLNYLIYSVLLKWLYKSVFLICKRLTIFLSNISSFFYYFVIIL